ncbi:MAG: carboxypeptidase-like regulatory domain-containing protein [Bacteroidota bacterium]
MLKKYTYLLSPLLFVLCLVSCHSDIGEVNPNTEQTNQITVPLGFEQIEGSLVGYVFDQSDKPISNAIVSTAGDQTTTNEFGVFSFQNTIFDPQGTFVSVEKEGYLIGSDLVYPSEEGGAISKIQLLKVISKSTFEASEGGTIEVQGGGTISFSPSSLIRINGSTYDGVVKATAYRLSPNDYQIGNQMAGGLLGIDSKGRHRVLSTFGVLAVELRGFDNQKLRIKSDKTAELTFPIDDELVSVTENNIPAWSFNFQDGLWYEKVLSTHDNKNFTVEIDELGFWNLALPSGASQVCGRLIFDNSLPAKNYIVQVKNNKLLSRIGITDRDGYFCGKLPMGESLKFQVLHPFCGNLIKEIEIGPFEAVGTIGNVELEVTENYLSGSVVCAGEMSSNSTIIIESEGTVNLNFPKSDGSFAINLNEILCGSNGSFTVFAYDNDLQLASEEVALTGDVTENLKLEVCPNNCLAVGDFRYEKQDYCVDGEFERVYIEVMGGSGEYAYQWVEGSTMNFINNPIAGQEICVNVIDVSTECEYTFCDNVKSYNRLRVSSIYASNTECQMNSGLIDLDIEGGKEPIEISWAGPDGFTSSEPLLTDLRPGEYAVTITDGGGCESSAKTSVYDVTTPLQASIEDICDQSVITIIEDEGYKPYTYAWNAGMPVGNQLYVSSPGLYEVTVTDANSCTRVGKWQKSEVGLLPVLDPQFECEEESVEFPKLENGYEYYYQTVGSSDRIPVLLDQGIVNVPILVAGYRFEIGSENDITADCYTSELIELPRFAGLKIGDITSVSCESCADGSIDFDVNIEEECIDCNPGAVIVLRADDKADVTSLNVEHQLEKGGYYVIVLDNNSGCYIAHALVEVE